MDILWPTNFFPSATVFVRASESSFNQFLLGYFLSFLDIYWLLRYFMQLKHIVLFQVFGNQTDGLEKLLFVASFSSKSEFTYSHSSNNLEVQWLYMICRWLWIPKINEWQWYKKQNFRAPWPGQIWASKIPQQNFQFFCQIIFSSKVSTCKTVEIRMSMYHTQDITFEKIIKN
jgi:hypothetical protein